MSNLSQQSKMFKNRVLLVCGFFIAILAVAVISAWYAQQSRVLQIHHSWVPMQFNTAIGFLLCGSALVLLYWGRLRAVFFCGLLVMLLALMTLSQYIFGISLGIDQFFMEHYITIKSSHPGRMAPNTALCFLLSGATLVLFYWLKTHENLRSSIVVLCLGVSALGLIAVIGYIIGLEGAYSFGNFTRMAFHTAFAFMLLGPTLLAIVWQDYYSSKTALSWPLATAFASVCITILLWQLLVAVEQKKLQQVVNFALAEARYATKAYVRQMISSLERMSDRLNNQSYYDSAKWQDDSRHYMRDFSSIEALWLLKFTDTIKVKSAVVKPGHAMIKLQNIPQAFAAIAKAQASGTANFSELIMHKQKKLALLAIPPYRSGTTEIVAVTVNLAAIFKDIFTSQFFANYQLQVQVGDKLIYDAVAQSGKLDDKWYKGESFSFGNRSIILSLSPKAVLQEKINTYAPEMILMLGLLLSLIVTRNVALVQVRTQQSYELHRAEQEVAERDQRIQAIGSSISDSVITIDSAGIIVDVNPAVEDMFEYTSEQLIGKNISCLMPEPYRNEHDAYLKRYGVTGESRVAGMTRELSGQRKSGEVFPIELVIYKITIAGKQLFTGFVRDITEKIAQQTALIEAEERTRLLLESVGEGIYGLDDQGNTTFVNRAAAQMLGYSTDELVGCSMHEKVHHSYPDGTPYPRNQCPMYATFLQGKKHQVSGEVLWRKDGSSFPVDYTSTPIRHNGQLTGAVVIFHDVSERVAQDKLLAASREELERSNESLQQFAYIASHDLQEPLRAISGYAQLLNKRYYGQLDDKADKFLNYITEGAGRLQKMINDLLAYSRIDSCNKEPDLVDLNVELENCLESLRWNIKEANVTITYTELPTVKGNVSQLSQLLQNLISNAIKYRSDRAPEIDISAERQNSVWYITVSDNGIGIDARYQERVFVVFQRLHVRSKYEGNGIGLALCKKIVERHQGKIWFDSVPGKGTSFHFTLPAADMDKPAETYYKKQVNG